MVGPVDGIGNGCDAWITLEVDWGTTQSARLRPYIKAAPEMELQPVVEARQVAHAPHCGRSTGAAPGEPATSGAAGGPLDDLSLHVAGPQYTGK